MQMETALGEKLKLSGFNTDSARLYTQATEALQNGRDFNVALHVFKTRVRSDFDLFSELCRQYLEDRASDMRGDRLGSEASGRLSKDQSLIASASRTNAAKVQDHVADKAIVTVPDAAPERNGTGQGSFSDKAKVIVPRPVSPAYLEAAKVASKNIAHTVLDSFKVRDGRPIGDLIFGELEGLRSANAMEASVILQIQRHYANVEPNQFVRDVIKAKDLERMIQRGAEVADAA